MHSHIVPPPPLQARLARFESFVRPKPLLTKRGIIGEFRTNRMPVCVWGGSILYKECEEQTLHKRDDTSSLSNKLDKCVILGNGWHQRKIKKI